VDGLTDGSECNTYSTNPFNASQEAPNFEKISNQTFLDSVVYPALAGNLELASASARGLGYTLGSDGLITLKIVREHNTSPPLSKYQLMGTLITGACGPSAYTNGVGITTTIANVCGAYGTTALPGTGTEPGNGNNDDTSPVIVRVPLSKLYTILSSTKVDTVTP
jgi:hypothetical protein